MRAADESALGMRSPGRVTRLLERHRAGDAGAFDRLVELVYGELRRIARSQLRKGPSTFSTTEVVHEAYLKLSADERAAWNDRSHFFAVAARAMRQILVDHAHGRLREKRGAGAAHVPLDAAPENAAQLAVLHDAERLLALDQALARLEARDQRAARVLECRFFVGLTDQETAHALDISPRSVQRGWHTARTWLARELGPNPSTA